MKKFLASCGLLFGILLGLIPPPVQAQRPTPALTSTSQNQEVPWAAVAARIGFSHRHICTTTSGDACGSNPPTFAIDFRDNTRTCGWMYSTSAARNTDGSVSNDGVRIILPTAAQMGAQGISPAYGREGQCEIQIVMGAPGPQNFLRLAMDGIDGIDKFTGIPGGAHDMVAGEIILPYRTPGVLSFQWNGVSWLMNHLSPQSADLFGEGQMSAHGYGRLFRVNTDPAWATFGGYSLVGKLAFCPNNGNGLISNSNGGLMLTIIPDTCVYKSPTAGGPAMEWIVLGNANTLTATNFAQGNSYVSGTAPNGVAFAAGNYVKLTGSTISSLESGDTITIDSIRGSLSGVALAGTWIVKVTGTDVELQNKVDHRGIGPPSVWIPGDTMTVAGIKAYHPFLTSSSIGGARFTQPYTGVESTSTTNRSIVGVVQRGPSGFSGQYVDNPTQRVISSWYQPRERPCGGVLTADRTATNANFVVPTSAGEINCSFVYLDRNSSIAKSLGDGVPTGIKWNINLTASNSTAGAGCEAALTFDLPTATTWSAVTTYALDQQASSGGVIYKSLQAGNLNHAVTDPVWWVVVPYVTETGSVSFTNPTGLSGSKYPLNLSGIRTTGLAETTLHTATVLVRTIGGGTCTIGTGSTLTLTVWD